MPGDQPWWQRLKDKHDEVLQRRWDRHLQQLNSRFELVGDFAFSLPVDGAPPAWFNGNIEDLPEDNWVLVISLNLARPPEGHYGDELNIETSWKFWRCHNRKHWNHGFFSRPTRLAAALLGETLSPADEPDFATDRMLYLEFCPYASKKFKELAWKSKVVPLAETDPGFVLSRDFRQSAIRHGHPAAIIVQGAHAKRDFAFRESVVWSPVEYQQEDNGNSLEHMDGWLNVQD